MTIGFDAKRAYHNHTGLGNYSRTLIRSLATYYPGHSYYVFNPKPGSLFVPESSNIHEIRPTGFSALFPSLWRLRWMVKDIEQHVRLYHGLSNELPFGISNHTLKTVVTIHDLIFEHYPEQYKQSDVLMYRKKFKHACSVADHIIAISEVTKADLVQTYQVPANKITVCYQSCEPLFAREVTASQAEKVKSRFAIDRPYFLSVGSIIERKNLHRICEALLQVRQTHDIQLLIVGRGKGAYREKIQAYLQAHQLEAHVRFLEEEYEGGISESDLAALYQNAEALIYPSLMEGFGIPVLEAMSGGAAVITSYGSSMAEVGGDAAMYIDPTRSEDIAHAMIRLLDDTQFAVNCRKKSSAQALTFTLQQTAASVMQVYQSLIPNL
jgi:glycosyltransferase involved in cell wall biosynthesis